jgi:hypothetical protein
MESIRIALPKMYMSQTACIWKNYNVIYIQGQLKCKPNANFIAESRHAQTEQKNISFAEICNFIRSWNSAHV